MANPSPKTDPKKLPKEISEDIADLNQTQTHQANLISKLATSFEDSVFLPADFREEIANITSMLTSMSTESKEEEEEDEETMTGVEEPINLIKNMEDMLVKMKFEQIQGGAEKMMEETSGREHKARDLWSEMLCTRLKRVEMKIDAVLEMALLGQQQYETQQQDLKQGHVTGNLRDTVERKHEAAMVEEKIVLQEMDAKITELWVRGDALFAVVLWMLYFLVFLCLFVLVEGVLFGFARY